VQALALPQERSFSPATRTHLLLLHWLSLEQKQPLDVEHSLDGPLQAPNDVQENLVAVELGHPPSGHGIAASAPSSSEPPSTLATASIEASLATSAPSRFNPPSRSDSTSGGEPPSESCPPSRSLESESWGCIVVSPEASSATLASQGSEQME
jgi:hypothetical protein